MYSAQIIALYALVDATSTMTVTYSEMAGGASIPPAERQEDRSKVWQ